MEYSLDGTNWSKLGSYGTGTNWYNRAGDNVWDSAGFRRWHTASIGLPKTAKLQLRFVMKSDGSLIKEGIGVDDIHVYDLQYPIYVIAPQSTPVTQSVSGNGVFHFTSNGKVIASVLPNGNILGNTTVQAYIRPGGFSNVGYINNQYYHPRNITIKPTNTTLPDSTTIRIYFTDAETDTMTRATGCSTCSKPLDAYGLGITKYDDVDDTKENGTLADNTTGNYTFINSNRVTKVPYDNGYYAEFKAKDFSEFWLNNGGGANNHLLPAQLVRFTVQKREKDVQVNWETANEINVDRYEIQLAKGEGAFSSSNFSNVASVKANNQTTNSYVFTDVESNKSGARYYRLKVIDKDGTYRYSETKRINFGNSADWYVYPNPVKGTLQVITSADAGTNVEMKLQTVTGQVLWTKTAKGTGQLEKHQLNINGLHLAAGIYILEITAGAEVKRMKLVKE